MWSPITETLENSKEIVRVPFKKPKIDFSNGTRLLHDGTLDEFVRSCALKVVEMGQILKINQLCINTAINFIKVFCKENEPIFRTTLQSVIVSSAVFLSCKTEEQGRRLEYLISVAENFFNLKTARENYDRNIFNDDILDIEEIILISTGFNIYVTHPHPVILRTARIIKASDDFIKIAYQTVAQIMILSPISCNHSSELIACVSLQMACYRTQKRIPKSREGKDWWSYIHPSLDEEKITDCCEWFVDLFEKTPDEIKRKLCEFDICESPTTNNSIKKKLYQGSANQRNNKSKVTSSIEREDLWQLQARTLINQTRRCLKCNAVWLCIDSDDRIQSSQFYF